MRKLTAHRWRLSLIMLVAIVFALGSFWLVQVVNQSGQQALQDQHRNEPDYIVERFSFVRMNKAGQPAYIIAGDKLTHRPVDDSSDIERPTVHSLAGEQPPMNMRADSAHVDQDNTRVQLQGKVEVERPATARSQAMRLSTPALTVYPDEDRMETDKPVDMKLGTATASGTGLTANNATRQLKLGGRGQIELPPRGAH
ncbi:MAG: LPS export ABC transporter periplasmic protein LptC [Sphingomonadaceae bacterium]